MRARQIANAESLKALEGITRGVTGEGMAHEALGVTVHTLGIYRILESLATPADGESTRETPTEYRVIEKDGRTPLMKTAEKIDALYASSESAPKGLRIKDQKHLWGSLGKDHIININWHLVFAPRLIAEYVVAHEMCHLKHKNHSPTFWRLLRSLFPQTDDCKGWLEKNTDVWEVGV